MNCDLCDHCSCFRGHGDAISRDPEPRPHYVCSLFGRVFLAEAWVSGISRISLFPAGCPGNTWDNRPYKPLKIELGVRNIQHDDDLDPWSAL